MENYIISVTICALAIAFVNIASPKNGEINKYIGFLAALVITIVILFPLTKDIDLRFDYNYSIDESDDTVDYNKLAADNLSASITKTIKSSYDLKVKRIKVHTKDDAQFIVEEIEVFVAQNALDTSIISRDLSNLYNCKITIRNGG